MDFKTLNNLYSESLNERQAYEVEWRKISRYLLPARGVYNGIAKPRNRKLTNAAIINSSGEDALNNLTANLHGHLTSPARPWFSMEWIDPNIKKVPELNIWLKDSTKRLHAALQSSDFYSVINGLYTEHAGFGLASIFAGSDTETDYAPFHFELLTVGEYSYSTGPDGITDMFFRTVFMSMKQIVDKYKKVPKEYKQKVKDKKSEIVKVDIPVVECVYKEKYKGFPIRRDTFLPESKDHEKPLQVDGFHEFPYFVARWEKIGQEVYSLGPGSRALPDIQRLQELEKSFLVGVHKTIDPPISAPARYKGKLNKMPGGENFYGNVSEKVEPLYNVNLNFPGVLEAIKRVEERIGKIFFNDIFIVGTRDPNSTPLKATEVRAREQEKLFRLGPVVESLEHEFLQPLIARCFRIMQRKELFMPLSPEMQAIAGEFKITLVSPLAAAQRSASLAGINTYLAFIANAAQFKPEVLDNVNIDEAAAEFADITGVTPTVLNSPAQVKEIRDARMKAAQAQKKQEEDKQNAEALSTMKVQEAQARKANAEAGNELVDAQQNMDEGGFF